MPLRKGPFDILWNGNTLADIESVDVAVDQDTEDHTTLDGRSYTFDGAITSNVTLKLLRSDIPSLAVVLPQYFVANGGTLSTGETVQQANGAIDVVAASCDESPVYGDLDIVSCGNPGQVFRLVNARTKIAAVDFDAFVGTVDVQFIGEPAQGEANVQFFTEGTIQTIS